jgi:hypothetical protein
MKPNKQRILSSQPAKPTVFRTNSNSKLSAGQLPKFAFERQPEFNLKEIIKNLKTTKNAAPFKFIQFDEEKNPAEKSIINSRKSYKTQSLSYRKLPCAAEEQMKEGSLPAVRSFGEAAEADEVCNNTTDTFKQKPESMDLYFGIIPNKYWCKRCGTEVISDVKMNLPTLTM